MSRLFFAITPDKAIIDELNIAVQCLNPTGNEKIVANNKLHLTLRYIGSASDEIKNAVIKSVNKIYNPVFTIKIDKQEYWNKPKISVFVPDTIPGELIELVEALEHICVEIGLSEENRGFKPHITVIRHSINHQSVSVFKTISWQVRDFVLLNSETIDGKLQYTEIGRWHLY